MKQTITKWDYCGSLIMTIKGEMTYFDWCCKEAARQDKLGRPAKVAGKENHTKCAVVLR